MRIHIRTSASIKIISYTHQNKLTGVIHKWIGQNNIHDKLSLYSFSRLKGGTTSKEGIEFKNGAHFFISCWDKDLIKLLIRGIQNQPELFDGLSVNEITIQEDPDLSEQTIFDVCSPVYIQRNIENGNKKFFFYTDKVSAGYMTETLKRKMESAGIEADDSLKIYFDLSYNNKQTKKINYKRGKNITELRASWCPIIIEGKLNTKKFAWNVGIGNSTGIGFGAIK